MSAAHRDYSSERSFIETSDDPAEVLGWMQEYRAERREADEDNRAELDALIEFAEDRVVVLKAARLAPKPSPRPAPVPANPTVAPAPAAASRPPDPRRLPVSTPTRPASVTSRSVETRSAAPMSPHADADDAELRELRDRARKARLRQAAAEAETARLEDEARVAAERERARMEQERARRREQARRDAQEQERIAAAAESKAKAAARAASSGASPAQLTHAPRSTAPSARPDAALARPDFATARDPRRPEPVKGAVRTDATPLSRLFDEALSRDLPRGERPAPDRAVRTPSPTRTPAVVPVAAPPAPVDDLPPLTGADLIKFREWLGVSQRALAAKFGVEQGTVSKGEGKPAAVLGPALRAALHKAMGEPRHAVGRAS